MSGSGERFEPVADAKPRLRAELLAARRALSPDALTAARRAVAAFVLEGLNPEERVVAAYEPLRTEPGSQELLLALTASGRTVLVPQVLPDRDLTWVTWPDHDSLGTEGIARADVVLVPALAVGRDGGRLGRGGGSYDRALARARGRTVALLHRGERVETVPTEPHDRPVDAVVTPDGWYSTEAGDARGRWR